MDHRRAVYSVDDGVLSVRVPTGYKRAPETCGVGVPEIPNP